MAEDPSKNRPDGSNGESYKERYVPLEAPTALLCPGHDACQQSEESDSNDRLTIVNPYRVLFRCFNARSIRHPEDYTTHRRYYERPANLWFPKKGDRLVFWRFFSQMERDSDSR